MNFKMTNLALALGAMLMAGGATAETATATLTANLMLTAACEVSPTATIEFGSKVALASESSAVASTGSTFRVACSASATAPAIFADAARVMTLPLDGPTSGDGMSIPFNLSLSPGANVDDLPSDLGSAAPLGEFRQDGAFHDVVIYGNAPNSWADMASGSYTGDILVTVVY